MITNRPDLALPVILVAGVLLSGCGGKSAVPVDQRNTVSVAEETERIGGRLIRIVQPNDTLYSIAFEAGLDYRDLAAWNGIREPYSVAVGQRVRLTRPMEMPSTSPPPVTAPTRTAPPSGATSTAPIVVETAPQRSVPASSSAASTETFPSRITTWQWPTTGRIYRGFGPNLGRKGIDIVGTAGQDISASAAGKVVYAGNGLRGYGNMIIVKHNEEFLSAYAHNRRIFVREGDWVSQGQRIAEMGDSGADRVMLHFEIRRTGEPVDPREYLPRGGNTG